MEEQNKKKQYYNKCNKFSYSKLNVFGSCGWKYYLSYHEGHFISASSINIDLGTLIHKIEQLIFNDLKEGKKIDYEYYKNQCLTINIPKRDKYDKDGGIYGINIIKQKYAADFYRLDEYGESFDTKIQKYLHTGIYRLEQYLKDNPNLIPYDAEKYFSITCHGNILSGSIDRIFYDKVRDKYLIEDIKTHGKPFRDIDLATPLQFVIYVKALVELLDINEDQIECYYDLPFCNLKQRAGTPGFIARGDKKLNKLFDDINHHDWAPNPSPLCYYCQFSRTNPLQPDEGKNLCPYYSKWTKENKNYEVAHKWEGMDKHEEILKKEIEEHKNDEFNFDF